MYAFDRTAWEILNATADDCESLEQIYLQICYELIPDNQDGSAHRYRPVQGAPPLSEVANRIHDLVGQGLLTAVMDEEGRPWQDSTDLSFVWRAWFSMTPQGRNAWEVSEYLVERE